MASSGSFNTSGYSGRYLTFSWSIKSQDINNNKTTIGWTLKGAGGTTTSWFTSGNFSLTINGSVVYSSSTRINLYNGTTVASGSTTIAHNSDGTKTFSASAQAGIYTVAVNCSGSGTFTLNTIPRATKVSKLSSQVLGNTITATLAPASSAFTHKTWYRVVPDAWVYIGEGYKTSCQFTPPVDRAANFPNASSGSLEILVRTFNGSTEIGYSIYSTTISPPASVVPTITGVTVTETVDGLAEQFGAFVQGKSKPKVSITASGIYGSTIKSYSIKIGSDSYSGQEVTGNILNGNTTLTATVTDSRGRTSAVKTMTIPVTDYTAPTCSVLSVERCDASGNASGEGANIALVYKFNISPVGNKNQHVVKVQYQNGDTWTDVATLAGYSGDGTYKSTGNLFSTDKTYHLRMMVSDYFTSDSPVTATGMIPTEFTLINFNASGKGLSFGRVSEDDTCEMHLPLGQAFLDQIYPVGSVYMSLNNTSPASLFGGSWVRIKDRFLLSAGDTYKAGSTGGEAKHVLTVAEQPNVHGNIWDVASQDVNTSLSGNGCFTFAEWGVYKGYGNAKSTTAFKDLITFDNGGKGTAHNNMPPYTAVYVWYREA